MKFHGPLHLGPERATHDGVSAECSLQVPVGHVRSPSSVEGGAAEAALRAEGRPGRR